MAACMADAAFEFRVIDPLGRDRTAYKELHNALFPTTAMSAEWLEWYHRDVSMAGGGAPSRTYAAFDGSTLVGVWSVEPRQMTAADGRTVPIGRCFAVGIHADYRRHGLFVALSKFAIAQEREAGLVEHIIGFPQAGRPVIGGHLKAGWEVVLDVEALKVVPASMDVSTPRSRVGVLSSFRGAAIPAPAPGSFVTTADYLDLRWSRHPDSQYLCYAHAGALMVLKPYGGVCHLLELLGDDEGIGILLDAAKTLCRRHGWKELNAWCAPREHTRQRMVDAGFQPGAEFALPVQVIAVRIRARTPLDLSAGCHLPIGVEEIY